MCCCRPCSSATEAVSIASDAISAGSAGGAIIASLLLEEVAVDGDSQDNKGDFSLVESGHLSHECNAYSFWHPPQVIDDLRLL